MVEEESREKVEAVINNEEPIKEELKKMKLRNT